MKRKGGSILIYKINKYKYEGTDVEYIVPEDMLEYGKEDDPKIQYLYVFICLVAKELNYYNFNTSTAFGNPDLEFYRGQIRGFLIAKQWEWDEVVKGNDTIIFIRSASGRTLFRIEKPSIPRAELNRRKEIIKELDALGL